MFLDVVGPVWQVASRLLTCVWYVFACVWQVLKYVVVFVFGMCLVCFCYVLGRSGRVFFKKIQIIVFWHVRLCFWYS